MIYILKNIGKGKIGLGERQVTASELILIQDSTPNLIRLKQQTLAIAGWVLNGVSGYYEYTLANNKILSQSDVEFIPLPVSYDIVSAAEIQPYVVITAGQVVIQAVNAPTDDILVDIKIERLEDV